MSKRKRNTADTSSIMGGPSYSGLAAPNTVGSTATNVGTASIPPNDHELITRREALKRASFLLGGLFFAPAITGVLNGCTARSGTWVPTRFSQTQAALIIALCDTILPETDTPSASQAGVPAFIEALLERNISSEEAQRFDEDVESFTSNATAALGSPFQEAEAQTRHAYVIQLLGRQGEGYASPSGNEQRQHTFLRRFREMCILGYCTSQAGATKLLRYAPIPGEYRGCIPFEHVGKTWAT